MSAILIAMEVLHITATIWQRVTTKEISGGGITHIQIVGRTDNG